MNHEPQTECGIHQNWIQGFIFLLTADIFFPAVWPFSLLHAHFHYYYAVNLRLIGILSIFKINYKLSINRMLPIFCLKPYWWIEKWNMSTSLSYSVAKFSYVIHRESHIRPRFRKADQLFNNVKSVHIQRVLVEIKQREKKYWQQSQSQETNTNKMYIIQNLMQVNWHKNAMIEKWILMFHREIVCQSIKCERDMCLATVEPNNTGLCRLKENMSKYLLSRQSNQPK